MRIATFNVLHGRSLDDGRVDRGRFADAVRALDADVLGLQEVDRHQQRSGGLDLAAVAADAMGATACRFVPALIGTPGGQWRPATAGDEGRGTDGPAYGIALLSRHPVLSWHVVRLGRAPLRTPVVVAGGRRLTLYRDEPRVAVAAVLEAPSGIRTMATTHLSVSPGFNGRQLRRLATLLADGLPGPHLLFGDLNLPGRWPERLTGWRPLAQLRTFPSPHPRVQIDHVLVHGSAPRVVSVEAPPVPVSDHRPLVVTLDNGGAGRREVDGDG